MAERSKMVITKSEEMSNQLQAQSNDLLELKTLVTTMTKSIEDLKTNLTGKIDKLAETTSTLENRIDKVNTDITVDCSMVVDLTLRSMEFPRTSVMTLSS